MKRVNYEALSPLLFLERSRNVYKDKIAIIDKNIQKSYQEFYNDCIALAKSFKKIGLQAGDRVVYLSKNNYQLLEAHYAVPMSNAVLIPVNIRFSEADICYVLRESDAKVLVVEKDLLQDSYLTIVKTVIIVNDDNLFISNGVFSYENFIEFGRDESYLEPAVIDENDTITINYTSGTSGLPKGVMYSHRGTYLNALGECLGAGLANNSNYLWVLPMFHCNGWCFTWAITAVGATHVCLDLFDAETIIDFVIKNKITHFCAAPTILINLFESKKFYLLNEIRDLKIITAGSPPSPTLIKAYEANNISLIHVYGLTETYGPHAICERKNNWNNLTESELLDLKSLQGVASIHSVFMRVVDEDMNDVPHDGISLGEVVMRGNNVMKGYYNNLQSTNEAFKGGWFHSGDVAVVKADGYIEIKDRLKDIIISGGENISSIEVENILYQHPAISVVAVIPLFDEKWGEIPCAVVELKEGNRVSEQELILYCRNRMAHYKCPKRIIFRMIPKTSTGKIQKNILKKEYYYLSTRKDTLLEIN